MVHFFVSFVLIYLSFDLYLSVVNVSMETADPNSGNLRGSDRHHRDVAKFHDYASVRRSEKKRGGNRYASIEDESNMRNVSTTDAPPINSCARDTSDSETITRQSKRLSLQNKPNTRDARKCVQTDIVIEPHE